METKIKELEALLQKAAELTAQISNEAQERATEAKQQRIALKREARENGQELDEEVEDRLFSENWKNDGISDDALRLQEHIVWALKENKIFK